MNELAYYLDRYFAELELKEILAAERVDSPVDVIHRAWKGQAGCCAAYGRLTVLENRGKKGNRGTWQAHHKKPIKVSCER